VLSNKLEVIFFRQTSTKRLTDEDQKIKLVSVTGLNIRTGFRVLVITVMNKIFICNASRIFSSRKSPTVCYCTIGFSLE